MIKYDELVTKAIELLKDENFFVSCCEELDNWNGFLYGDRLYNMEYELDELHYGMKLSDFLQKVDFSSFDFSDEFWYYNAYGNLVSTNETKYEHYSSVISNEELFDNILDNYCNLDIKFINKELNELLEEIDSFNEDKE